MLLYCVAFWVHLCLASSCCLRVFSLNLYLSSLSAVVEHSHGAVQLGCTCLPLQGYEIHFVNTLKKMFLGEHSPLHIVVKLFSRIASITWLVSLGVLQGNSSSGTHRASPLVEWWESRTQVFSLINLESSRKQGGKVLAKWLSAFLFGHADCFGSVLPSCHLDLRGPSVTTPKPLGNGWVLLAQLLEGDGLGLGRGATEKACLVQDPNLSVGEQSVFLAFLLSPTLKY